MADHRAIEAVSNTIAGVLAKATPLESEPDCAVRVVSAAELTTSGMEAGVGLYLYRVSRSAEAFAGHALPGPDAIRQRPVLVLDLHYILVVSAPDGASEQRIAGWTLAALEETPVLSGQMLADAAPGVFGADEFVEVLMEDLSTRDLNRIVGAVGLPHHRLALPYVVRGVRIAGVPLETSRAPATGRRSR